MLSIARLRNTRPLGGTTFRFANSYGNGGLLTSRANSHKSRTDEPLLHLPKQFGENLDQDISLQTRDKLERIAARFPASRWAMAYGSGVFDQVGSTSLSKAEQAGSGQADSQPKDHPMVDFLIATSHPSHFHDLNLQQNPSHYPFLFRWLGPKLISTVQEWAAGLWYVTDVDMPVRNKDGSTEHVKIKYGIISVDRLCSDLLDWKTLYVSGRMHKPVRIVKGMSERRVLLAAQVNLTSALRLALLQLPERFSEIELWEKVAGISYSGDPRMTVPGGENRNKVQNIVSPQLHRFRGLYGQLLSELGGVRPDDQTAMNEADLGNVGGPKASRAERELAWRSVGLGASSSGKANMLRQDKSTAYRAQELLAKLPRTLRHKVATHYCTQFNVQLLGPGDKGQPGGPEGVQKDVFWNRVAQEPEDQLRQVLDRGMSISELRTQ